MYHDTAVPCMGSELSAPSCSSAHFKCLNMSSQGVLDGSKFNQVNNLADSSTWNLFSLSVQDNNNNKNKTMMYSQHSPVLPHQQVYLVFLLHHWLNVSMVENNTRPCCKNDFECVDLLEKSLRYSENEFHFVNTFSASRYLPLQCCNYLWGLWHDLHMNS